MNRLIVIVLTTLALSACGFKNNDVTKDERPASSMTDTDRQVIDLYLSRSKIVPSTSEEVRATRVLVEAADTIRWESCTTITGKSLEDEVYCDRIRKASFNLRKAFNDDRNTQVLKSFK